MLDIVTPIGGRVRGSAECLRSRIAIGQSIKNEIRLCRVGKGLRPGCVDIDFDPGLDGERSDTLIEMRSLYKIVKGTNGERGRSIARVARVRNDPLID